MGLLVEDLLLLARLDRGAAAAVRRRSSCAELIRDAATSAARGRAGACRSTVDIGAAGRARWWSPGTRPGCARSSGNLVTNALTHTPPGTPVTLRLRADGT